MSGAFIVSVNQPGSDSCWQGPRKQQAPTLCPYPSWAESPLSVVLQQELELHCQCVCTAHSFCVCVRVRGRERKHLSVCICQRSESTHHLWVSHIHFCPGYMPSMLCEESPCDAQHTHTSCATMLIIETAFG